MTLRALQDLFRRHREKATGLWKLGQDPNRTIYLDSGDVVFAQSSFALDRLTHLLVERGKLTQAQLDYALANLKPGISIGKNLIEMGFITQRDLLETARAQVERIVAAALGTPDEAPTFEPRELDASVVRLPFDTPLLLLQSLLGLKDREGLLELLGPLNQVVLLQGKRLQELTLPADLAKLPPLLDGTHTLLELSREALAEPLRLGAFALFLREMGWARLHEMPPVDRGVLDLALVPEAEPLKGPLPDPPLDTIPSLFSTIQAAAKPTTNLEHLSEAFDALPEPVAPSAEPERDASGFTVETGQAILPTPAFELPEPPALEDTRHPEVEVPILPGTLTSAAEPLPPPPLEEPLAPRRSRLPILGVSLGLVVAAALGYRWMNRPVGPAPAAVQPPPPSGDLPAPPSRPQPAEPAPAEPVRVPAQAEPPKVEPSKAEPPKPDSAKVAATAKVGTSVADRAGALRRGELDLAVRQGQQWRKELPAKHWTLRLEIACQGETVRKAVGLFPEKDPDLWVLPLSLRDGRGCYQVFFGHFPSKTAAEAHLKKLPAAFRSEGNRPKSFMVSDLSERQ